MTTDDATTLAHLTGRLALYDPLIGGWPTPLKDPARLQEVRQLWQGDAPQFLQFYRDHLQQTEPKVLLAEFLRMGHNIDIPRAAHEADMVLTDLFRLDEFNLKGMLCRAKMYVSLSPQTQAEAERLFAMVLARSGESPDPALYKGLGFACLQQHKADEAMRHFEAYLARKPDDSHVAALQARLQVGERPQLVQVDGGQTTVHTAEHRPGATAATPSSPRQAGAGRPSGRPWWRFW